MMRDPDANVNLTASLRHAHRWRMAVSGLVIFVAGITLGAAGALLVVKPGRRPPLNPRMAAELTSRRMQEKLSLTPEQVDQIEAILQEHFETLEKLRETARPKISQAFEDMKTKIDAVLTEQQRSDWEEETSRLEQMFRRGMGRRRGGPPGPGRPGGPEGDFRDGRGRFRGPGPEGGHDDDHGPRDWRPGPPPPGEDGQFRRGWRDPNGPPSAPLEPAGEQADPNGGSEPNTP